MRLFVVSLMATLGFLAAGCAAPGTAPGVGTRGECSTIDCAKMNRFSRRALEQGHTVIK